MPVLYQIDTVTAQDTPAAWGGSPANLAPNYQGATDWLTQWAGITKGGVDLTNFDTGQLTAIVTAYNAQVARTVANDPATLGQVNSLGQLAPPNSLISKPGARQVGATLSDANYQGGENVPGKLTWVPNVVPTLAGGSQSVPGGHWLNTYIPGSGETAFDN